jgi:hypothetical protein
MATLTQLDALILKYQTVFDLMPELGVQLTRIDLQGSKVLVQAEAPSEEMKRRIWDQITVVDPMYPDLICEITINPSIARRVISPALIDSEIASRVEDQTYVVQPGDTLEKISHMFYGDPTETRRILEANPNEIDDPNRLEPGIILYIPGLST